MKRLSTLFISMFLACSSQSAMAGGWGAVFAIELRGDGLERPIEIADPSAFERLRLLAGRRNNITIGSPWIEHQGDSPEQPIHRSSND